MRQARWMTLLAWVAIGCVAEAPAEPAHDSQLAREAALWERVRNWGNWAEYEPTLSELVDSADAAVVARLVSVAPWREVAGDASDDVYTELLVEAEVSEVLRDSTGDASVSFSLSLLGASSLDERDETLAVARSALPIERVLLVLRQRSDAGSYRVVNGYGIWASTERSVIDAPLEPEAPLARGEAFPYAHELRGIESLEQLIDSLR